MKKTFKLNKSKTITLIAIFLVLEIIVFLVSLYQYKSMCPSCFFDEELREICPECPQIGNQVAIESSTVMIIPNLIISYFITILIFYFINKRR